MGLLTTNHKLPTAQFEIFTRSVAISPAMPLDGGLFLLTYQILIQF